MSNIRNGLLLYRKAHYCRYQTSRNFNVRHDAACDFSARPNGHGQCYLTTGASLDFKRRRLSHAKAGIVLHVLSREKSAQHACTNGLSAT